ncbi:HNH endonuclease signature motif containing protein [Streptomyces luteireticuli]|uniref:HNH nuclease domain-containing protein n=1 Tax=Streptomyces luteireticuli TaxID=173858 RepID=A0ABN0Z313_9ACTN
MQSHRKRREAIARGNNAAARLRAALRAAGSATCARCGFAYLPSAVDVDHVTPLARGGEDVEANVQVLCRTCHRIKTAEDFGHKVLPF